MPHPIFFHDAVDIRFVKGDAVDVNPPSPDDERFAGQTYDPLDEPILFRDWVSKKTRSPRLGGLSGVKRIRLTMTASPFSSVGSIDEEPIIVATNMNLKSSQTSNPKTSNSTKKTQNQTSLKPRFLVSQFSCGTGFISSFISLTECRRSKRRQARTGRNGNPRPNLVRPQSAKDL